MDPQIIEWHCISPNNYGFTLSLTAASNYTIWFSAPNGTLFGMPSTISSGVTLINGQLYLPSGFNQFCIQVDAYDSTTGKFCIQRVCWPDPLPECIPQKKGDFKNELLKSTGITLVPNPASEYVDIYYGLTSDRGSLSIVDVNGKRIKLYAISDNIGSINLSTVDLNPGIYFVRLFGTNGECNEQKLVIIK